MTIYDVLRRIIEARPFQDFERIEALKILDDLEAMGALGTLAGTIREDHAHQWTDLRPAYSNMRVSIPARQRCTVCNAEREI